MNFFMHPLLGAHPKAIFNTYRRLRALPTFHFLPKFIFVVLVSILNWPFILLDNGFLFFVKKKKQRDPIFIIGHPRTGTTHLQQVLAEDPQFYTPRLRDVLFPNFPNTFGWLLSNLLRPFLPKTRPQDNVSLNLDAPQEEEFALAATTGISFINGFYYPRHFKQIIGQTVLFERPGDKRRWQQSLQNFVRRISPQTKNRQLILKSPANMARIAAILEIYPNARFIHIERDPEHTLQSTLHLFESVVPQTSFQFIREDEMLDNAFYMYEVFYKAFREQEHLLKPWNLLTISHEAFIQQPQQELDRIYAFAEMDCQLDPSVLRNYKNYRKNRHTALPGHLRKRLKAVTERVAPLAPIVKEEHQVGRTEKVA